MGSVGPRSAVRLLVWGPKTQGDSKASILAHWWAKPDPRLSGCRVLGVLKLELAYWWLGLVPDTTGCGTCSVQSLCLPTGGWGQILGWLSEWPKVSQN